MNAKFYYNSADKIVLNKYSYLTQKDTATVYYKDETNLVRPIFVLEADKIDKSINYVYIGGKVDRYYFINDVTFSHGRIYLKCEVDVLYSHRTQILKNEFLIWRNQKLYNRYLQDDRQLTEASSRILTFPSTSGFAVGSKTASYILTIGGKG